MAISDNTGATVERRHYDPWGNIVKLEQNGVNTLLTSNFQLLTSRGYTGHEHFFSFGIIHMNGRIYDPVLRSFMSPDPFIQAPDNSQNYNRYAYCLNNPLLYTDPSGNLAFLGLAGVYAAAAIGALIGGVTYTAMAFYQGEFSWGGLAKSIIIGGISGAATFGIGEVANSINVGAKAITLADHIAKAGFQAAAHGTFQGFVSVVSGGNFEQGFVSGALSSIASSAFQGFAGNFAKSGAGTMLFGTVAGGVGATLTGGDFLFGAAQGFVVSSLNHVAHMGDNTEDQPDNEYDKDGKLIGGKGGDITDYKYDKKGGTLLETTSVKIIESTTSEIGFRFYGTKQIFTGNGMYDPSLDIMSFYTGVGELRAGFFMLKNGITMLSKAKLGLKVLGGASKGTLKSSVIAKGVYGSSKINLLNGSIKRLPYANPFSFGTTSSWSSFYGRNSAVFGVGRMGIGTGLINNAVSK